MRLTLFAVILIALASAAQAVPQAASQSRSQQQTAAGLRKSPCKVPENAAMCYWTRGRLSFYSIGLPEYRMWKVGTKRLLGIYSGPVAYPPNGDSNITYPEFPPNLERVYDLETKRNAKQGKNDPWLIWAVFADYEVCPLEPEHPGWMQSVCIESAKNIFVEDSKQSYR